MESGGRHGAVAAAQDDGKWRGSRAPLGRTRDRGLAATARSRGTAGSGIAQKLMGGTEGRKGQTGGRDCNSGGAHYAGVRSETLASLLEGAANCDWRGQCAGKRSPNTCVDE